MKFSSQVRAARASLYWEQKKLADEAGLSVAGIQKVERGETGIAARTQKKIIRAFEKQGVFFTKNGIELDENPIIQIDEDDGESCYLEVLSDVFTHLKGKSGAELLIVYADDRVSPPAVNELYRKIRAEGVKMRQLVEEGNTYLLGAPDEYRFIPARYFINRVSVIYADRVATVLSDESRATIIVDALNADIQRNSFNIFWEVLPQPEESTVDEKF